MGDISDDSDFDDVDFVSSASAKARSLWPSQDLRVKREEVYSRETLDFLSSSCVFFNENWILNKRDTSWSVIINLNSGIKEVWNP